MNTLKEDKQRKYLERLQNFRLLDDDFMTACFQDYLQGIELVIQIIMNNKDLRVTDVKVQHTIKNLYGRSLRLDVYATDTKDKKYNFEIQRDEHGAGAKRARLHSALIDSREIPAGFDPSMLPETYVIFITEGDALGGGLPIYHIDRYVGETGQIFPDEAHIIYVNAQIQDDTELGKLMRDFWCTNACDMHYQVLAERVRYLKEVEKGVRHMCKAMEEFAKEERYEEKIELVTNFLRMGKISVEDIAEASGLSVAEVQAIKDSL